MIRNGIVLVGFVNPLVVYPAPLVALIATPLGYALRFPDGTEHSVETPDSLREWAHASGITLLNASTLTLIRKDEFLYGLSAQHVIIGNFETVTRNLLFFLGSGAGDRDQQVGVMEFITEDFRRASPSPSLAQLRRRLGGEAPFVGYVTRYLQARRLARRPLREPKWRPGSQEIARVYGEFENWREAHRAQVWPDAVDRSDLSQARVS